MSYTVRAATLTAVSASISTPGLADHVHRGLDSQGVRSVAVKSIVTPVIGKG